MGKLRIEPKAKPPVTKDEYAHYKRVLGEAQVAALDHHVFYDLDDNENPKRVRKALQYVATQEAVSLSVRALRKERCLALRFHEGGKGASTRSTSGGRIPAEESRSRILSAIESAGRPLKKSEIVTATGISASSWNLRIKELLEDGSVKRKETGRATAYQLG